MLFYDFYAFYATSLLIRRGGDIYDPATLARELQGLGVEEALLNLSPPWTLWSIAWLAYLPLPFGIGVWTLLSLVCLWIGISAMSALFEKPRVKDAETLLSALFFFPAVKALFYGQNVFLPSAAVFVSATLLAKQMNFLAGVILSLALIKPHLVMLLVLYLVIRSLVFDRNISFTSGLITGFLAQLGVSTAVYPALYSSFAGHFEELQNITHEYAQPNLFRIITDSPPLAWIISRESALGILYAMTGILSLILAATYTIGKKNLLFIILPLSVLLSPYSWSHDFIYFLPIFMGIAWYVRSVFSRRMLWVFLLAQFAASAACFIDPHNEIFMIILPLILLTLMQQEQVRKLLFRSSLNGL